VVVTIHRCYEFLKEPMMAKDSTWKIVLGELDEKMGVEVLEESPETVVARGAV